MRVPFVSLVARRLSHLPSTFSSGSQNSTTHKKQSNESHGSLVSLQPSVPLWRLAGASVLFVGTLLRDLQQEP